MTQAVRRRHLTAVARVQSCGFAMNQVALGRVIFQALQFSPVSAFSPMLHDRLCITDLMN